MSRCIVFVAAQGKKIGKQRRNSFAHRYDPSGTCFGRAGSESEHGGDALERKTPLSDAPPLDFSSFPTLPIRGSFPSIKTSRLRVSLQHGVVARAREET